MEGYLPLKVGDAFLYYRQHLNDPETADPQRSLFVCRLDKKVKAKEATELFQQCGTIETVQTGKFEKSKAAQGASPGSFVYFAVVTFKKRVGLKNALRQGWLQGRLDSMQMDAQPEDAVMQQHVEKMEEGGFQMVLSKSKAQTSMLSTPQVPLKTKKDTQAKDFYTFQLHPDDAAPHPLKKPRTS